MKSNLMQVALGERPADLVVSGGKLVNVLTREIYRADVAISGDRIAATGDVSYTIGPDTTILDAQAKYITPGLIDQHIHVHETQLNMRELAVAVLPHGTTGICTDFYGETVVCGSKAARLNLDIARQLPLKVWFALPTPAYYQDMPFGHCGQPTREEMLEMIGWPECCGMDDTFASKINAGDESILELIDSVQARGKKVMGHGSEERGRSVNAWVSRVRATDDHECANAEEAIEKARAGLYISIREGSGCFNLAPVIKSITEGGLDSRRFCFCTDLISPSQIAHDGHIDNAVRKAIRNGVSPVVALQMATLNAAECLNLDQDYGSVNPGKIADLLLIEDLAELQIAMVIASGRVVARNGQLTVDLPRTPYPHWAYHTVHFPQPIRPQDFAAKVDGSGPQVFARVIRATGQTLLTGEEHHSMTVQNDLMVADPSRDLLKIAAIERVQGTGEIGVGFIRGFNLRSGAIATTYNSQQQNMIVIGASDSDMAIAANRLAEVGGGFILVDQGETKALLELPLFGLESEKPYLDVVDRVDELNAAVANLGCELPQPFHTLGFMGLPVEIGTLKISPKGLVNVWEGKIVNLQVD